MQRQLPALVVAALCALVATAPADAQPHEDIVVGGMVVLRIQAGAGGLSIAQRAKVVRGRIIDALMSADLTPGNFHRVQSGAGTTIKVGQVSLITVTVADARAHGTTVEALSARWLAAFRTALPKAKPTNRP